MMLLPQEAGQISCTEGTPDIDILFERQGEERER